MKIEVGKYYQITSPWNFHPYTDDGGYSEYVTGGPSGQFILVVDEEFKDKGNIRLLLVLSDTKEHTWVMEKDLLEHTIEAPKLIGMVKIGEIE